MNVKQTGTLATCVVCLLASAPAGAQDVRIVKSGADKTAISLSAIRGDGSQTAGLFTSTLRSDLVRSGWFSPDTAGAVVAARGTVKGGEGQLAARVDVVNTASGRSYLSHSERVTAAETRRAAHRTADAIVEAVKGKRGIAATRIVLVGSVGGRKDLYVCDADGQGVVQLTRDGKPCLSPRWDGKGESIYYTSFHGGYPDVYRISLADSSRARVSAQPGLNAGPDISPDGKYMALTLSRDGNPEVYVMHLRSGRLERLTRTRHATEASPSWSPDGRELVFVSDRSGSPQLYRISSKGGQPTRLSFRGSQNVSPDWGPDGRIAFSSRREGRYHICVMDPGSRNEERLTAGGADHEEPSWAPDGRHIVYVKTVGYGMHLYVLDTLGDAEVRLTTHKGDWYAPAWSPR